MSVRFKGVPRAESTTDTMSRTAAKSMACHRKTCGLDTKGNTVNECSNWRRMAVMSDEHA